MNNSWAMALLQVIWIYDVHVVNTMGSNDLQQSTMLGISNMALTSGRRKPPDILAR